MWNRLHSGHQQGSLEIEMKGRTGKVQKFEGKEKERYSLKMIPVINSPEGRKGLAD